MISSRSLSPRSRSSATRASRYVRSTMLVRAAAVATFAASLLAYFRVEAVDDVRGFLFCSDRLGDETGVANLVHGLELFLQGQQFLQPL